ncbi:hypothetical protein [Mariniflexile rhizosphaerae]|uniref:hypothetical protein n=1 Tax=unclassified Mariniflexile TaxID=2643887 RepID=UPI0013C2D629|nr:hypothetical protein [Mariniflexile sp. TRM1-10]
MTKSSGEIIRTSLMTGGAGGIGMAIKNKFNLNNSPKALLRGVQFTSPLEATVYPHL